MGYFSTVDLDSSEKFVYTYINIPQDELEKLVDSTLASIGYKHKGGGEYEKGSRTKRLLLGAFHKYFKLQVSIDASDPQAIKIGVLKKTSGMSGGLIGMNDVKNEMVYLKKVFQAI